MMAFSSLIIAFLMLRLTYSDSTGTRALITSDSNNYADYPCPPWYTYEDPKKCSSLTGCRDPSQLPEHLECDIDEGAQIQLGYCITYNEHEEVFQLNSCYYFQSEGHNITEQGYVKLPDNISELNDYMCGLMNRKGPLCSRCVNGFGPSLTSDIFMCSNCTNVWYGVPLYLLVEFLPITVLYLIVLTFQISFTSSPMTCFVLYSHVIFFALKYNRTVPIGRVVHQLRGVKFRIIEAVYGVVNLEIVRFIVPPFCVSSKLQFVHISFLEYLTAFYPLFLILLTWICIELHGRNFKPLVWGWSPFHRCFVRLRRDWSTKSDLVGVFASFFLLSYNRIVFQSILLINCPLNDSFSEGDRSSTLNAYYDPSVPCNSPEHIGLAVLAAVILCLFNILPALLLVLYPIKAFRVCLFKCKLDRLAIATFVNKFHGCYRDGLDGGRDMRSLSGLYFFIRILLSYVYWIFLPFLPKSWLSYAIFYTAIAFLICYLKPYKNAYMNILDVAFLIILSLLSLLLTADYFKAQAIEIFILILIPAGLLILFIISKQLISRLFSWMIIKQKLATFCCKCCKKIRSINTTENVHSRPADNDLQQSITSTIVSINEV